MPFKLRKNTGLLNQMVKDVGPRNSNFLLHSTTLHNIRTDILQEDFFNIFFA